MSEFSGCQTVIVDGYVWLDANGTPGLGGHLYEALAGKVTVVGVAKTVFRGAGWAIPVTRGSSAVPLFVTAAGIDPKRAAEELKVMHGPYRLPTLLKRVDRLCRQGVQCGGEFTATPERPG